MVILLIKGHMYMDIIYGGTIKDPETGAFVHALRQRNSL